MRLVCCWAGDPTSNHWRERQRLSMLGTRATGWGMKNSDGGRRSRKGATSNTKSTINRSIGGVVTSAEAVAMVTVAASVRAWENEKNEYNHVSVYGSDHFVGEYWHRPNCHVFCFPNLVSWVLTILSHAHFFICLFSAIIPPPRVTGLWTQRSAMLTFTTNHHRRGGW